MRKVSLVIFGLCMLLFAGSAMGATFNNLGDQTVGAGGQVSIPIAVSDSTGIAGAAFTVSYDTSVFTGGTVTSTFFDTFQNQFTAIDPNYSGPTQAETGETQPVVENEVTATTPKGLMVAAARARAADASANEILFTFTANVASTATPGSTYTFQIVPTTLDNESAGYDPAGEQIPLLVGANETVTDPADPNAFPVLLAALNHTPTTTNGIITISDLIPGDVDGQPGINALDVRYLLFHIQGYEGYETLN